MTVTKVQSESSTNGTIATASNLNYMTTKVITTIFTSPTQNAMVNATMNNYSNHTNDDTQGKSQKGYWQSPGKVAGTFVVVGVVVVVIIAIVVWYFLVRPRNKRDDFERQYNDVVLGRPSGDNGRNSSSVSATHEFVYTDEKGIIHPKTPATAHTSSFHDDASSDISYTRPVIMDQRLDPTQMMAQIENTKSKVSLADDVDYSRKVLRVIND